MRSEISTPTVKKRFIGIVIAIVVLLVFLNIGGKKDSTVSEDSVYRDTIGISRTYVALRLKTDKILKEAASYPDYKTWNKEMTKLIDSWEDLDLEVSTLDEQAGSIFEEKVSLKLVNVANAYTKDEISNVFDKAPAGKKIRTLAKYLGVDAKRAFKILKTDQDFVKADAWNEAGDTFKKLEVSAIVIKDGCKVAGFIGAMAMTGGAVGTAAVGSAGVGTGIAAGSATLAEGTIMVVTGTDLMLEISEDAATIALGDNHKAVKTISNIRSVTDPAASLLSLTDIPKNIAKGAALLDKVGVVLVQVDQVRSMVQDGKLLGIKISPDSKIEVATIEESEAEEWIEEYEKEMADIMDDDSESLEDWLDDYDDIDDWLDELEVEDEVAEEELKEEEELEIEEDEEDTNNKAKTEKELFMEKYRL